MSEAITPELFRATPMTSGDEDGGEREPIDGDGEAGALLCEPLPSACSIEIETAGPTL